MARFTQLLCVTSVGVAASCGFSIYGPNKPGGGENYGSMISAGPDDYLVTNKPELLNALELASSGDTIYVDTDINLSGEKNLVIPQGVTLASNRGQNGSEGALLYTTEHGTAGLFSIPYSDVRVTGLRVRGPSTDIGTTSYDPAISDAFIANRGVQNLEFDNNELWGWSHGAIFLDGASAKVHDNYIHHNQRTGLGYGVVMSLDAWAVIERNIFDYNRHAVAGTGDRRQGYVARYNLVLTNANSHIFDMHGEGERVGNPTGWAGHRIIVHNNIILHTKYPGVMIRGKPKSSAWIFQNDFAHANSDNAVNSPGRTYTMFNCYNYKGWFVSDGGVESWYPLAKSGYALSQLAFGDFNGDGQTDVFRSSGSRWYVSYSAKSSWTPLAWSGYKIKDLAFGDFDGDTKTDVFRASGQRWYISSGGTGAWKPLASSSTKVSDLLFADFNGDRKTDVFYASGSRWYVSYSGTSSWKPLASSSTRVNQLVLGDFNGDGKADVFHATGSRWIVSYGGTSSWQNLATSSYSLSSLKFGDFNSDEATDVFVATGSQWKVSYNGRSSWQSLATSSYRGSSIALGDFDGDGSTDVFRAGAP